MLIILYVNLHRARFCITNYHGAQSFGVLAKVAEPSSIFTNFLHRKIYDKIKAARNFCESGEFLCRQQVNIFTGICIAKDVYYSIEFSIRDMRQENLPWQRNHPKKFFFV